MKSAGFLHFNSVFSSIFPIVFYRTPLPFFPKRFSYEIPHFTCYEEPQMLSTVQFTSGHIPIKKGDKDSLVVLCIRHTARISFLSIKLKRERISWYARKIAFGKLCFPGEIFRAKCSHACTSPRRYLFLFVRPANCIFNLMVRPIMPAIPAIPANIGGHLIDEALWAS